jgi:hypothetical protein
VEVEKSAEIKRSLPFADDVGTIVRCPEGDVSKSEPSEDKFEIKVETCFNPCGGDAVTDISREDEASIASF